nr:MAG: polyprotein 2 [Picornavirales sp.]
MYTADPASLPDALYDCIGERQSHSIQDFLKRPVIISQGTWNSSQVQSTVLANLVFPRQLFNTGAYTVAQNINKLDGFVGLRAKVKIRIAVNSQPFQAGALMLHYVPYSEYMASHTQWYATNATTDLHAASGCPHVIMNLANTTSMEFTTPYISPYLFFNLPTGQGSFGNIVITVMAPLSSQAASSANFTIWANFEDIDLRYPTSAPLTSNFAQVGSELAKMENRQTISSTVGGVGRGIASVLPWVGLGWLSSPARALSDAAEGILKHLGFSKPSVEAPVTRMKQAPAQYFLNSDGADTSHKLGLSATNELTQYTGWAGTDDDEMQISYIAARPCYMTTFTWDSTQPADEQIFQQATGPLWTQTVRPQVANAYARTVSMPLLAKLASMFSVWSCTTGDDPGGFLFRFHVVKTQYHSGRLRISFSPYDYTDNTTKQNMPGYNNTEVIDLSAGTDFTYFVPFVSVRQWMHTYYDVKTSLVSGDARNSATGTIQLAVINPLVSAPTVASSVDVLVYVSMVGAMFAAPVRSPYLPFGIPNVAQNGGGKTTARIVPTSENSLVSARRQIALLPYTSCLGEAVLSLRQLAKRFSFLGSIRTNPLTIAATGGTPGSTGNGFVIFPWAPVIPQNGTIDVSPTGAQTPFFTNQYNYNGATGVQTFYQQVDTYSQLYSMYAFFRGSIRIKICVTFPGPQYNPKSPVYVHINNVAAPSLESWTPPMQITPALASGPSNNLGTGPLQPLFDIPANSSTTLKTNFAYQPGFAESRLVVYPDNEGIIEFEVPFHATGPFCPTNYGQVNPTNARSIFYPFPTVTITGPRNPNSPGTASTLSSSNFDVFRACGDDFSFGGLLGSPTHALWSSTVNPT